MVQNFITILHEVLLVAFGWLLPVALCAWLAAWSAECGVRPVRRLLRLLRSFSPLERGVLVVLVSACVLWGAVKPGGGAPPLNSPRRTPRMSLPGGTGGDDPSADFRIVDFHATPSSVVVSAAWSADAFAAPPFVEWFVRTNLLCGVWEPLGWVQADAGSTNVVVEIADAMLPDPSARAAFFTACAEAGLGPDGADDDGDGIANGEERSLGTNPRRCDTDGDGLDDDEELSLGTSPIDADTDDDDLPDGEEASLGTNPRQRDTDGDGLPDGWEAAHGLDPLSALGDDGSQGDFDGDGLLNADEYARGTSPAADDTDGDGLSDLMELGGVTTNSIPWLQFETCTNLTTGSSQPDGILVTWPLPEPLYLHGVCVTEVTVDSNGLVYFNRKGGSRAGWSVYTFAESKMSGLRTLNADSFTIAPFWDDLYLTTVEPASAVSAGTAVIGTNRCLMIQYDGVCPYENRLRQGETNSISWQLVVPFGDADRMYVRYSSLLGVADGRGASIGFQDFGGTSKVSYCYHEPGKLADGTSFSFAVGVGTNPLAADTLGDGLGDYSVYLSQMDRSSRDADDDGMPDDYEMAHGLDPLDSSDATRDADNDGMPNGWEVRNGFDPFDPSDAALDDDDDGLSALDEYLCGTNPVNADTDGDGLDDGEEVNSLYTDPLDVDSDGDNLPDGWEHDHELNPNSASGADGTGGDYDGDGLTNWKEFVCGSDPNNCHTFDAFVTDPVWIANGFCALPPMDCVSVSASVGDPSGSYSEMWSMLVQDSADEGRRFLVVCDEYGGVDTGTLSLERGHTYEGTLEHLGTEQRYPDYDWEAQIDGRPSSLVLGLGIHSGEERWVVDHEKNILIDNRHGLLGTCDQSFGSVDYTQGKSFTITAVKTEIADGVRCLPVDSSEQAEVVLTTDSTQLADWTIEPMLVAGARLHTDASNHDGSGSIQGSAKVYVTAGLTPTNYVIRARHPMCTNSVDEIVFTVCRIDVTNVRFNHDTSSSDADGVNLRSDFSTLGFSHDLGEWKTESGEVEMNFPVCYKGGVLPTVQAKFMVTPSTVASARIFARQQRTGSPLGGLLDAGVNFSSGVSDWVTFTEATRVPSVVALDEAEFEWYVGEVDSKSVYPTSVDITGPHRVYVVLADPVEPWSSDPASNQCAWTNALELACGWALGASSPDMAAACVTRSIYESGKFKYDTLRGASFFTQKDWSILGLKDVVLLSNALNILNDTSVRSVSVNCTDCASFVTSFSNLLGCELYSSWMGFDFDTNPYAAIGCLPWTSPSWGWGFSYHEVAWSGECGDTDMVFDACLCIDGDADPCSYPRVALLPTGIMFSDGNCGSPFVYRERLATTDSNGYENCRAIPARKKRRSLR